MCETTLNITLEWSHLTQFWAGPAWQAFVSSEVFLSDDEAWKHRYRKHVSVHVCNYTDVRQESSMEHICH